MVVNIIDINDGSYQVGVLSLIVCVLVNVSLLVSITVRPQSNGVESFGHCSCTIS